MKLVLPRSLRGGPRTDNNVFSFVIYEPFCSCAGITNRYDVPVLSLVVSCDCNDGCSRGDRASDVEGKDKG